MGPLSSGGLAAFPLGPPSVLRVGVMSFFSRQIVRSDEPQF
jgi:hypothetical protein